MSVGLGGSTASNVSEPCCAASRRTRPALPCMHACRQQQSSWAPAASTHCAPGVNGCRLNLHVEELGIPYGRQNPVDGLRVGGCTRSDEVHTCRRDNTRADDPACRFRLGLRHSELRQRWPDGCTAGLSPTYSRSGGIALACECRTRTQLESLISMFSACVKAPPAGCSPGNKVSKHLRATCKPICNRHATLCPSMLSRQVQPHPAPP